MKKIPFYKQLDSMDCGPTVMKMITAFYGIHYSIEYLREITSVGKTGSSLLDLNKAANTIGFESKGGVFFGLSILTNTITMYTSLESESFCYIIQNQKSKNNTFFYVADPGKGLLKYTETDFLKNWRISEIDEKKVGVALLLEPTPNLHNYSDDLLEKTQKPIDKIKSLSKYFTKHKTSFYKLIVGLFIGSILQLIFPFLTQSIVDKGIGFKNLNFIYLVLIGQLMLIFSRTAIDFIRRRILLRISTKINISLLTDFFSKLMNLSMSFFDKKLLGDILQRIDDHKRVETFLTNQTLNLIFSFFSFIVFSIVLIIYRIDIFLIFLLGSIIYGVWLTCFLSKRKGLDYMRFEKQAINQNKVYQLINGMQEIKLQGLEEFKKKDWEESQTDLFSLKYKILSLQQLQEAGGIFINELKNVIIIALSAILVIRGELTLGMMLSIQYIIGQLNTPIMQLLNFLYEWQDVNISLDRINEIHSKKNENQDRYITHIGSNTDVNIKNLTFKYPGANSKNIIENLNLVIPSGKVTAIVGSSGSGKTTLIKLLLGYYQPTSGDIFIGDTNLNTINLSWWRSQCGVVTQESYIFSATIADNIVANEEDIQFDRLKVACEIANITDFINKLPLKYNTIIGQDGQGLSQGQKQRILIARSIYKNPKFLFLDEATNALDANNEKHITENMDEFYTGKTVLIVAHRLSTVKNADQIIVLDGGQVTEKGTHDELISQKGMYYQLVKNQLELGS